MRMGLGLNWTVGDELKKDRGLVSGKQEKQ